MQAKTLIHIILALVMVNQYNLTFWTLPVYMKWEEGAMGDEIE